MNIWYRVSDVEAARAFYTRELGFEEVYFDAEGRWIRLVRNGVEIALAEGEFEGEPTAPETEAVAAIDVPDVKEEAERLRDKGIEVGVVLEIPGTIRILDVFDPDGNRLQLTQDI
jgi:catechol 2,3-dioxygenase-like lactoylglutathione lyase family enzyme